MFENQLRKDMERSQFANSIGNTGFTAKVQRERVPAGGRAIARSGDGQYHAGAVHGAEITPEQVKAYYDANAKEFTVPEQVKPEYIELSIDALAPAMQVPAEDVKKFYEVNSATYVVKEQRKASHILINAAPTASDAEQPPRPRLTTCTSRPRPI